MMGGRLGGGEGCAGGDRGDDERCRRGLVVVSSPVAGFEVVEVDAARARAQ